MNKTSKLTIITCLLTITILLTWATVLPVNAADPVANSDIWFVAMQTATVPGSASTVNGIYTNNGSLINFNILRSPPGTQGSTIIGNATSMTDLVFNTINGLGSAIITMTINFSDTNVTRNPYGVGVIQGKAVNVAVTALYPSINGGVGNASGTLIAYGGTGAFANAVFAVDFIMTPYPSAATGPLEAMFFGTHSRVNGRGLLSSYYLALMINSDAWFVAMPTSSAVSTNTSTTNGIYRNTGYTTVYNLLRSPPGTQGSTIIGNATSSIDLTFNTATGFGSATVIMWLNFSDTNITRNPYGVGTFQATALNVSVTSLLSGANSIVANATGFMLANGGTGAFAKTSMFEDFIMTPYPSAATGPLVAMFFGTHSRVNGTGLLLFQNLPPALTVSTSQSSESIMSGATVSLSASASGGYAPYTYQWYLWSSNVGSGPQISFSQTAPGTYSYTCKVTDSENNSINSNALTLIVNSPPTPAPSKKPIITPSPTPTQTPTPTTQPTLTATPSPTETTAPQAINDSNNIIIAVAAIALLAVIIGVALVIKLKKH